MLEEQGLFDFQMISTGGRVIKAMDFELGLFTLITKLKNNNLGISKFTYYISLGFLSTCGAKKYIFYK